MMIDAYRSCESSQRGPVPPGAVSPGGVLAAAVLLLALSACTARGPEDLRRFTLLDAGHTNVTFSNRVADEEAFNILEYLYFYDGGGVAVGDINNDGLPDLYFTANLGVNRLYVNRGDLTFEDVTETAGVGGRDDAWSTGVTMADVNGDGWLDIYVCQVSYKSVHGRNLLYVNNQDGTFTEAAEAYGLDFEGLSTQAAFFDYDRDGDLDLYLLNHAVHGRESFVEAWRRIIDAPRVGDRLYRNDGGRFTNVTSEAGIYSSALGYGLGVAISDVNRDGWPDIYVGNDFHENDYLYLNNGDGTFSEDLRRAIGHTSRSSMGNDAADINNDGLIDIVSLDMLPEDLATYRRSGGPDPKDLVRIKTSYGYAPQYARNTLQLHRGLGPDGLPRFSEIGRFAGIHATDWSWSALLADLDNDGWKDLYVTNGILRRPNDLDYVAHVSRPDVQDVLREGAFEDQLEVIRRMPSVPIPNYAYRNNADLTFTDRASDWGLADAGFSNGAAYGDLDGDGDLELVVNNINGPASIYRNNTDSLDASRYLSVKLEGDGMNTTGNGASVSIYAGEMHFFQEQYPTRGFQSSVSHVLHFGLGAAEMVDSLLVVWPDGRYQRLDSVDTGRRLALRQSDATGSYAFDDGAYESPLFADVTDLLGVDFVHRENEYLDFEAQPLMPHRLSTQGPALAVGDANGNGLDDLYVGGARGQSARLYLQQVDGTLQATASPFDRDRAHEDVDAAFVDVDGDGDLDLYVVSGGGEHAPGHELLQDRLYLNDGRGTFARAEGALPEVRADGCCVAAGDFDEDGDVDLFVGSRSVPGSYGRSPQSYLLENDGTGRFHDVTAERAPSLHRAGMITDAVWADMDGSGRKDLVLVGEWMPVTVLRNTLLQDEGARLVDATNEFGLAESTGWWRSVAAADLNGDGRMDLVAGNLGTNTVLRASKEQPLTLYVDDVDGNGTSDPIIVEYREGRPYMWARRDELLDQLPDFQKKIPTYSSYSDAALEDLVDPELLREAGQEYVRTFRSSVFQQREGEGFVRRDLPDVVQWSPVMDVLVLDIDGDGEMDLMTADNFFGADDKQGRYDAGYGTVLLGDGRGGYEAVSLGRSGFLVEGEARKLALLQGPEGGRAVAVARNDAPLQVYRLLLD